jgi:hypothetical protein
MADVLDLVDRTQDVLNDIWYISMYYLEITHHPYHRQCTNERTYPQKRMFLLMDTIVYAIKSYVAHLLHVENPKFWLIPFEQVIRQLSKSLISVCFDADAGKIKKLDCHRSTLGKSNP